jgi:subtilisin family serine protease
MHNAPAYSKDGAGTSFAAPKVAHIAAHIQNHFPAASPLLYRALIVQSARWRAGQKMKKTKTRF